MFSSDWYSMNSPLLHPLIYAEADPTELSCYEFQHTLTCGVGLWKPLDKVPSFVFFPAKLIRKGSHRLKHSRKDWDG